MKVGSRYCMNFWKSLPSIYFLTTSYRSLEELSLRCGPSQAVCPLQHLHHGGSSLQDFPEFSALFMRFAKLNLRNLSKLLTKARSSSPGSILYFNIKYSRHRFMDTLAFACSTLGTSNWAMERSAKLRLIRQLATLTSDTQTSLLTKLETPL